MADAISNWANFMIQPGERVGPDISQVINAQQLAERLRASQQERQGYNALARIMQDPQNMQGGLVNQNALSQVGQTDPRVMLEVMNAQSKIAQQTMATQINAQKFKEGERERLKAEYIPLVTQYEDDVKTLGVEGAQRKLQEGYNEVTQRVKTGGSFSAPTVAAIPNNADINRMRANLLGPEGVARQIEKAPAEARAESASRRSQFEFERGAEGEPKPFMVPDGKGGTKEEMLRYNKDTRQYLGDNDRVYRQDEVRPAKEAQKLEYGKVSQIAIDDPDTPGDTKIVPAQQNVRTGQWVTADANRDPLPTPKRIVSTGGAGGGQAQTQAMAMINAGNEATASVANLVELPVGATSGWFKGLTSTTPETISAAIGRGIAGQVNGRDARSLQISWQGIGRSLATLEAAGRATGLVGLQKQAETLQPQVGDTYTNVLRSYAEIRQLVARSIETIKTSPVLSSDQKKLLTKIEDEVKSTVPWTVHDVNMLEKGGKDSVLEFARKIKVGAGNTPTAAPAQGTQPANSTSGGALEVTEDQYNKLPSGSAYRVPGNPKVMFKP
jgi:hypothetical protein